jgi:hypothetical protein
VSELNPMPCYVLATVAVFHSSKIVRNHVQGKGKVGFGAFVLDRRCGMQNSRVSEQNPFPCANLFF